MLCTLDRLCSFLMSAEGSMQDTTASFIQSTSRELSVHQRWKTTGLEKSAEYYRLRNECVSSFGVTGEQFDEWVQKSIIAIWSKNGTVGQYERIYKANYAKFRDGVELGADPCYQFVDRIEQITMTRERPRSNDIRNIPGYGKIIGEEYRMDYNEMKGRIGDFEIKCHTFMTVGQCWEYFYPEFMAGIADENHGPIRAEASSFIENTVEIIADDGGASVCERLGREKSVEYHALRRACFSKYRVPASEFDERIGKYVITLIKDKYEIGYAAISYEKFKKGIDAAELERAKAALDRKAFDPSGFENSDDRWPEDLERE